MPNHSCLSVSDPRLVGDPVDALTGAVLDRKLEFRLTGPLELWWYRHYDSSQHQQRLAQGWGHTHDFDRRLRFAHGEIQYEAPVGRVFKFPKLEQDGDRIKCYGFRLLRLSARIYRLFHHGEPAMEFGFLDFQQPARLRRLFKGDHQILFQYDAKNRLESICDSAGRTISVIEAADGRLLSLTLAGAKNAPGQLLMAYEYDQQGNLIATRDAAGHGYAFNYDTANRMVEFRGRKGFKFSFSYDEQGRCIRSTGEAGLYEVRLAYQVPGRVTKVQRADGGVWTYNFDTKGHLTTIRNPLGGVQQFSYDESGRATGVLDPNGNLTRIVYDDAGAPVAKVPPLGPAVPLPENPYAPDPLAHREAANPAEYEYGRLLDLNAITLPDPVLAQSLPLRYEAKRLVATRLAEAKPGTDGNGFEVRPLAVKWWPKPEQGRVFSDSGQLLQQRDEWNRLREWAYDPGDNVSQYTDFDGGKWWYDHGSWALLKAVTNPAGATVKYSHNAHGEVTSFTDAGGTRSDYVYDLQDRLIEVRRHDRTRDRYSRDAAGNLVAKHAADGRPLLRLEIGPGNRPVKRLLSSGDEHTFEYDKSGRHLLAATKKDTIEFAYDALGNCSLEQRNGLGVANVFQGWRKPAKSVFFEQFQIQYGHGAGQPLVITDPGGMPHEIRFLDHGLMVRRFGNRSTETSQFDNLGRCHFKYTERRDGRVWKRRYHWSGEGELRQIEDSLSGEIHHEYDAAHRLRRRVVAGQVEDYQFDAADNLLRQPGVHEVLLLEGNRLHSVNGLGVTYNDRNHVETRQTVGGPMRYGYDSRDQLVLVETPRGNWLADYDPLGRRTRKTWAGKTTEYYWYGDQLIAEVQSDGRLRLYVYTDPLAMTPLMFLDYDSVQAPPESCQRHFIFADQVGAPCLIEDESGAEVWRARIAPFGRADVASGAKIEFNLRFPGHYFDPELELHYNRFRYYDPNLGRYLQSDPWGIAGGYNVYAYCANPLLQADVRGLGGQADAGKGKTPEEEAEGQKPPAPPNEPVADLPSFAGKTGEEIRAMMAQEDLGFINAKPDVLQEMPDGSIKNDNDKGSNIYMRVNEDGSVTCVRIDEYGHPEQFEKKPDGTPDPEKPFAANDPHAHKEVINPDKVATITDPRTGQPLTMEDAIKAYTGDGFPDGKPPKWLFWPKSAIDKFGDDNQPVPPGFPGIAPAHIKMAPPPVPGAPTTKCPNGVPL